MILNRATIYNFKGIEEETLTFNGSFNLIIGDNGIGKTSILEAISIGLGGFIAGIEGINAVNFSKDDIRMKSEPMGDGSYNIEYMTPTAITCEVACNDKAYKWSRSKSSVKSSKTTIAPRDITHYATDLLKDNHSILPIINYQSAGRMWTQKREKWENPFKGQYSRGVGYTDCLASESNTKMFTNWCKRMEHIAWQQGKLIGEYEAVKQAVATFMSELMQQEGNLSVFYDKRSEELMYQDSEEAIPLRLMSSGYRSLVGMVADIAYRMAILNPNLLYDVTKLTDGIILIDELDLHLHPKWQWKIVDALRKTFPRVQFIATTHSPIIIASAEDVNIINLYDENSSIDMINWEPKYEKSAKGWKIDDV
ncbi:MAG: AAA family ATPase, partial [Cellulosilyticaceae bacterium]